MIYFAITYRYFVLRDLSSRSYYYNDILIIMSLTQKTEEKKESCIFSNIAKFKSISAVYFQTFIYYYSIYPIICIVQYFYDILLQITII